MRSRLEKRLGRLESRLLPRPDGVMTYEEICRAYWRTDKAAYIEHAKTTDIGFFIPQFEREDAELKARLRPRNGFR